MTTAAITIAPMMGIGGIWEGRRKAATQLAVRNRQPSPVLAIAGKLDAGANAGTKEAREAVDQAWTALVRRCLGGDPRAWTELVQTHHSRVYTLCYRFTGSTHDAEDLTQDVFLKIYGSLKAFDPARGSLAVWVTTLTRNHLVDHYRRSRLQRASDSLDAAGEEWEGAPRIHLEDARPGPHAHALQRELERQVQAALASVSPELREAVILRDLQDMDYKEIAAVLHVPEGTVKSRISRGRAELARVLSRGGKQVS